MSLFWSIWFFNFKVAYCINNFPFTIIEFDYYQKKEICIAQTLTKERK